MFKNKVEKEITKKFKRIGVANIKLTEDEKTYCKMQNFLDSFYHKAMSDADSILKNTSVTFNMNVNGKDRKVRCLYKSIKKIAGSVILTSGNTRRLMINDSGIKSINIKFDDRDFVRRLKTLEDQYSKFANQTVSPVDIIYEKGKLIKITQEIKEIYKI